MVIDEVQHEPEEERMKPKKYRKMEKSFQVK
jgi:hypothetical protein